MRSPYTFPEFTRCSISLSKVEFDTILWRDLLSYSYLDYAEGRFGGVCKMSRSIIYGNEHQKVETLPFTNYHNESFRSVAYLRYPAGVELSPLCQFLHPCLAWPI